MRVGNGFAALLGLLAFAAPSPAQDEDPPEDTSPITRIVKVLRHEDGKPIAGAVVAAFGLPDGPVTKTADAEGTARFEKMPRKGVVFVARAPGRFCAWHEPGGFSWATIESDLDLERKGFTTMTLGLRPGTTFEGRVFAEDGKPLVGARVTAMESVGATDTAELGETCIWQVTTDAEGRFRSDEHHVKEDGRTGLSARVTAAAPGFISEHVDAKPRGKRPAAEFKLRRAALLRGVVTNTDGTPASGTTVHAYPWDFGAFCDDRDVARTDEDEHPRVLEAATDAAGRYEMPELPPGVNYFVHAERKERPAGSDWGVAVARSRVAARVHAEAAGKEAVCDLTVRRFATLHVRVAKDAGGAAPNVDFRMEPPPHTVGWRIDEEKLDDGGVLFKEVDPGTCKLLVGAEGWMPLERAVELAEGEKAELTVRLERGASIEGVVVDDEGRPAARVPLYAYAMDPAGPGTRDAESRSARTDASGAFRLAGLPPGPVDVGIADDRFVWDDYVRLTAPSAGVRIVVVRAPRIKLQLDAPPGTGLPRKVRAMVTPLAGKYAGKADIHDVDMNDGLLDRIRPGPQTVTVDLPGFAPASVRVDAAPGAVAVAGRFTFESGGVLEGRIADAQGAPVANARVTPYENGARTVTTDASGTFVLPHLAKGDVGLEIAADGLPETRLVARAEPGAAPLAVVIRPGGVVRGTVKDGNGRPLKNRRLCIYAADAADGYVSHWHGEPGKAGAWSLRLPAGRYRFVESRYDWHSYSSPPFGGVSGSSASPPQPDAPLRAASGVEKSPLFFEVTEGGATELEIVLK